jgi:hypothetical protein
VHKGTDERAQWPHDHGDWDRHLPILPGQFGDVRLKKFPLCPVRIRLFVFFKVRRSKSGLQKKAHKTARFISHFLCTVHESPIGRVECASAFGTHGPGFESRHAQ